MTTLRGNVAAVVLAGGSGSRMEADGNKAYIPLAGRRLVAWSLNTLSALPEVGRTLLVTRAADRALAEETVDRETRGDVQVIEGGPSRHGSEWAALCHLRTAIESGEIDLVLIHDAARPLVTLTLSRAVLLAAAEHGGAVPGLPVDDLATVGPDGRLDTGVRSGQLVRAQTPQAFHAAPLLKAYAAAMVDGFEGTDTSASIERYTELAVHWVTGDPRNVKVTYPQDLFLAERLLEAADYKMI